MRLKTILMYVSIYPIYGVNWDTGITCMLQNLNFLTIQIQ